MSPNGCSMNGFSRVSRSFFDTKIQYTIRFLLKTFFCAIHSYTGEYTEDFTDST